jgi:CRP-like cAMP-binding protein
LLTQDFQVFIQSISQPLQVKKGEYLFLQGDTNDSLFFIKQGLLKAFYQTHEGNEWVKSFLVEGDMIGSLQAVVGWGVTSFSLLCLEDCDLLRLSGANFLSRISEQPQFFQPINQMLLQLAMKKERREYELLCLSAEERYQLFCERDGHLLERLPQQEIAKYIGITPVALSRIRKRLGLLQK